MLYITPKIYTQFSSLSGANNSQKNIINNKSAALRNENFENVSLPNMKHYISFGSKLTTINGVSRAFSQSADFLPCKKIPDGFKMYSYPRPFQNVPYLNDSRGRYLGIKKAEEQITIIDRKKDKNLQSLISKYTTYISEIKGEFGDTTKHARDWKNTLIENTKLFINEINKSDFVTKTGKLEEKDLDGKETYLGDVYKNGLGVCRHASLLNKLLLETQGVDIGIKGGYVLQPEHPIESYIGAHCWNYLPDKSPNKSKIVDVTYSTGENFYLDQYLKKLYINNPEIKKIEQFKMLNPGEKMAIGLNHNSELINSTSDAKSAPLLNLHWDENDNIILSKPSENAKIYCNDKLLEKETILTEPVFIRTQNSDPIKISPKNIRMEYKRRITSLILHYQNHDFNSKNLFDFSEGLTPKSFNLYLSPTFSKLWNEHNLNYYS